MTTHDTKSKIPAEWEPQSCLWVGWPSHNDDDRWPGVTLLNARQEIAAMISVAAEGEAIKVLACTEEAVASAQIMVVDVAEIIDAEFGDVWMRDTGPIFTRDGQALRFRHNGWGGKYLYDNDDTIGDIIAARAGKGTVKYDYILEGGALDHNGHGVILTTRQCVLNDNRNQWNEDAATKALQEAFGAQRICWLDQGLKGDHTDGHVDNLARFVGENTVICQQACNVEDPNAALYEETAQALREMGFDVVEIPSPGRVVGDDGNVMPASYMNFIITNSAVIVPGYGALREDEALLTLKRLFPDRKVVSVSSRAVLTGGGSFHCITQQEPAHDTK